MAPARARVSKVKASAPRRRPKTEFGSLPFTASEPMARPVAKTVKPLRNGPRGHTQEDRSAGPPALYEFHVEKSPVPRSMAASSIKSPSSAPGKRKRQGDGSSTRGSSYLVSSDSLSSTSSSSKNSKHNKAKTSFYASQQATGPCDLPLNNDQPDGMSRARASSEVTPKEIWGDDYAKRMHYVEHSVASSEISLPPLPEVEPMTQVNPGYDDTMPLDFDEFLNTKALGSQSDPTMRQPSSEGPNDMALPDLSKPYSHQPCTENPSLVQDDDVFMVRDLPLLLENTGRMPASAARSEISDANLQLQRGFTPGNGETKSFERESPSGVDKANAIMIDDDSDAEGDEYELKKEDIDPRGTENVVVPLPKQAPRLASPDGPHTPPRKRPQLKHRSQKSIVSSSPTKRVLDEKSMTSDEDVAPPRKRLASLNLATEPMRRRHPEPKKEAPLPVLVNSANTFRPNKVLHNQCSRVKSTHHQPSLKDTSGLTDASDQSAAIFSDFIAESLHSPATVADSPEVLASKKQATKRGSAAVPGRPSEPPVKLQGQDRPKGSADSMLDTSALFSAILEPPSSHLGPAQKMSPITTQLQVIIAGVFDRALKDLQSHHDGDHSIAESYKHAVGRFISRIGHRHYEEREKLKAIYETHRDIVHSSCASAAKRMAALEVTRLKLVAECKQDLLNLERAKRMLSVKHH